MALTEIPIELSSTPGIVDNSNATAITIDSSERVLIGKTATGLGASGTEINPNGYIQVTEDQSPPLYLNRLNTDGSIVNFYKDGTVKGSIGTTTSAGGSRFAIGAAGDPGIIFAGTGVFPATQITASDNSADLGSGNYRWKDLYLSGGAYLGGTGAANKLEDYETGVWTPVDQNGNAYTPNVQASYTKIGRLVYFNFDISSTAVTTGPFVYGLPFPALAAAVSGNWSLYTGYSTSNTDITGHINSSSSKISIYVGSTAHTLSGRWMGAGSYYAA